MYKFSVITLTFLATLTFTGCEMLDKFLGKKDDAPAQAKNAQQAAVPVDVIVAKKADNKMNFEYPTRLQSQQDVVMVAKVSGTIIKQNFKPGQSIKAGDVLFLIEPDTYEAMYEVAKANILQAEASLKNAKSEADRVKKLLSQKAVSQKDYDNTIAALETANANLASAKANAKTAKLNLDYTRITAPFDGVAGENLIDVGAYVIASNTQLVRLTKTNPIEARFYIADSANLSRINNLANNSWVQINTDANLTLNGENFSGKVTFIDNTVDVNTGSVLAKAEFQNSQNKLLAGAFAKIIMTGFVQKDSFLIPQIAIKQDTISPYILVAQDEKVVKKPIKITYQTSTTAIVTEGINDNDQIIINNFGKIGVGASVKPQIKE
ncbi:efflux RND transporter periplasmic adaptor subunit [Campylobacter suis]|uniref:Multidrug efflux pump subunit AcrA n=1 Tax=Campylobacter suis TaxID=2790657 RepID=A0ABM8Q079_9BACT|nr:efflux RND transporter periplasmic adaptor subunit [Campylobacter suis]CAD7286194.1 Multidrug efflux pump subunit AcrA [Campylobacter suis]